MPAQDLRRFTITEKRKQHIISEELLKMQRIIIQQHLTMRYIRQNVLMSLELIFTISMPDVL